MNSLANLTNSRWITLCENTWFNIIKNFLLFCRNLSFTHILHYLRHIYNLLTLSYHVEHIFANICLKFFKKALTSERPFVIMQLQNRCSQNLCLWQTIFITYTHHLLTNQVKGLTTFWPWHHVLLIFIICNIQP